MPLEKNEKRRKKVPWIAAHLEDILCISHMGENFRLIIIINTNINQTQIRTINKQDQSGAELAKARMRTTHSSWQLPRLGLVDPTRPLDSAL